MTEQVEAIEAPGEVKPKKEKRKYTRLKKRTVPRSRIEDDAPFRAPDEFAGLTETECCAACSTDRAAGEVARRRMAEIEMAYPRGVSQNPQSQTVMESDAEWLNRNTGIKDEWLKLVKTAMGHCIISGISTCGHPFKGGLSPRAMHDPKAAERYAAVRKLLAHRKIDLRGAA